MSRPVGCPHEYPGSCSYPECGCWTTVISPVPVQSIPRGSPLVDHMRKIYHAPEETTMAKWDHDDLRDKSVRYEAPLVGKSATTDLHHTNSDVGSMTQCRLPLAEFMLDDEKTEFRLAAVRSLQIDIDNMYRLRRSWALADYQAAETLRSIAGSYPNSERYRSALNLAARKLDELATAQEQPPRIFALVDRDGTMVEIPAPALLGADSPSAAVILRRATEHGAVRILSFLTTLNTPLMDFPDPAPVARPVGRLDSETLTPSDLQKPVRPGLPEGVSSAERIEAAAESPRPTPTQGDIEGLQQSQACLQTQLAQAEQALRALVAAVTPLQVNGHDLTSLDTRLNTAVETAQELLAEYEPTDLATRSPRY